MHFSCKLHTFSFHFIQWGKFLGGDKFHNGTCTTRPTYELRNSSNSYFREHLLPSCGPLTLSRDQSNTSCDLITVKPLFGTTRGWWPAQETWCVALVCRCACFCSTAYLSVCLVGNLLFHPHTRFKWKATQELTVLFPFHPFWKRYRPAIKVSRECAVHTVIRRPLSLYSKWE